MTLFATKRGVTCAVGMPRQGSRAYLLRHRRPGAHYKRHRLVVGSAVNITISAAVQRPGLGERSTRYTARQRALLQRPLPYISTAQRSCRQQRQCRRSPHRPAAPPGRRRRRRRPSNDPSVRPTHACTQVEIRKLTHFSCRKCWRWRCYCTRACSAGWGAKRLWSAGLGRVLGPWTLATPAEGFLALHDTVLKRYRVAAGSARTIHDYLRKAKQEPVAAPPRRHTTLRQAYRASQRAIARAGGDVPVFLYGDNAVPRPVAVKPPPPQLQRTKPKWGIKASAPVLYAPDDPGPRLCVSCRKVDASKSWRTWRLR
eukprot:COSAG02_NODE_756_length_17532_cov_5.673550_14_plen_313_part_00